MSKIEAVYYNGISSKSHPVQLDLNEKEIKINGLELMDEKNFETQWQIDQLEDIDFSSSDTVHLKYGEFPFQTLIINDLNDVLFFRKIYPELGRKNIYRSVLSGNIYKMIAICFTALILIGALYLFMVAPFIAEKAAGLIPQKAEIKLGEKMTEHLFATMDFDEEKSETLTAFFESTGFKSSYPIKLYVEESSMVNAFAVPGGQIVVFQGIIDQMDTWEELAGLLGHELAHVEEQHSLKGMCRNLSTYFVFSAMTGDVSGVSAVLLEKCLMLKDLSNSRSAEREADQIGFEYLLDQNINPKGMVDLFKGMHGADLDIEEVINSSIDSLGQDLNSISDSTSMDKGVLSNSNKEKLKRGTNKLAKMLSTHPATDERIDYLNQALQKYEDKEFPKNLVAQELFEQLKD